MDVENGKKLDIEKRTVRNKSKTGGLNYADFSFKFKRTYMLNVKKKTMEIVLSLIQGMNL